ncbi:MAG: DUF5931 domain-containing protein [Sporichthyaceae bacterium]|nr:DUF5931 domain-containing protein [Sporichthyaceae bacterium]
MFELSLWRALTVFRWLAVGYAALLYARDFQHYLHPVAGWLVLAVMVLWTAISSALILTRRGAGLPLLLADLAVTFGCTLAVHWIDDPARLQSGALLPSIWVLGPALAWGIARGTVAGALAAVVVGGAQLIAVGAWSNLAVQNTVLMLVGGAVMGYVAELGRRSEARLAEAVAIQGAVRERERLARTIHDGVLQVLTLVARRGRELGGEAAELGRLAADQETALRALIATGPAPTHASGSTVDLRTALSALGSASVTVSGPATELAVPARVAAELTAAVRAALDNVREHAGAGAHAWVLVEDDTDAVLVSVRDNGRGFPPDRLAEAARDGRLGIAQSIHGRINELGGSAVVTSSPGSGCEVELRVPKARLE